MPPPDASQGFRYDAPMAFHLAQLNIGLLLHLLDDPLIQEYIDGLQPINRLAEQSPGLVWRLQTESGNATAMHHAWSQDPFVIVSMPVWKSPDDLKTSVYRLCHLEYGIERSDWFGKLFPAPLLSGAPA